ncbi:MAG: efflux RND transporter permease subunit, partial [Gammaproteobacteria bacterium]|nr:efflux RND transporter permease subunit [Gammaproteobacteria bacterium]
ALGMLVDNAIVIVENIFRHRMKGESMVEAARVGAAQVSDAVVASTLTTVCAFGPMLFWPGIMGEFMKYLPITLIATLSASLFMALLFVPTLGGMLGRPRQVSKQASDRLLQVDEGDIYSLDGFTGLYVRVLKTAMHHAWKVIISTLIFAALVFSTYAYSGLGMQFFPDVEPEGGNIYVRGYGALSIYEKDALMSEVEEKLLGMKEIETLYTYTGGRDRIGRFRYNLIDWQERRKAVDIIDEMKQRVDDIAGIEVEIGKDESGINKGKDLEIELSSRFPELMDTAALKIRKVLEKNPKFTDIDDTRSKPGIEWLMEVDRTNAARYDADAALVGNMVQLVTNGLKVGEYRPDDVDEELEIRIRFPQQNRSINRLDDLRIRTDNGLVPISNFVKRVAVPKIDSIEHINSRRVFKVRANMIDGELLSLELPKLKQQLPELGIDPRVNIEIKGENTEQQDSKEFLQKAFLVALFVMAIILVTQFNSFYQAFLILSAVLFSTVGVFLGLLIFQKPFGIVMSGIGVISLAGIIVNNNIVLIDTYNVLRNKGMQSFEAILRTG